MNPARRDDPPQRKRAREDMMHIKGSWRALHQTAASERSTTTG
jgi:hypothetical protein